MAKENYRVGFDLGGTKMLAVVFDGDFKEKGRERKRTKAHEGAKAGLDRIIKTIEEALAAGGVPREKLSGIGIGCPSPLDFKSGTIIDAPNLGWKDVPLRTTIESAFKCPVVVANDVDAGTYGEYRFGAAQGARCAVGIFPGTGIGGACIYKGEIILGKNTSCMEVGHLPMVPRGQLCGCGQRGCLETVASRMAVAAAAAAAAYRGEAPNLLRLAGTDLANIRSGMIAEAIKAGDASIDQIVRHAARWLGHGVAATVNLLAPEIVVIGGGMAEAMPKFYMEEIEESARSHCMGTFRKSFKIVVAELGDDATVLGAAALSESVSAQKEA